MFPLQHSAFSPLIFYQFSFNALQGQHILQWLCYCWSERLPSQPCRTFLWKQLRVTSAYISGIKIVLWYFAVHPRKAFFNNCSTCNVITFIILLLLVLSIIIYCNVINASSVAQYQSIKFCVFVNQELLMKIFQLKQLIGKFCLNSQYFILFARAFLFLIHVLDFLILTCSNIV